MKGMGSFTTRNNKTDRYFSDQNFPKDDLLHSVLSFQVVKNLSLSIPCTFDCIFMDNVREASHIDFVHDKHHMW